MYKILQSRKCKKKFKLGRETEKHTIKPKREDEEQPKLQNKLDQSTRITLQWT